MFTADDILARLRGQPFVPLRIVTSAGQSFNIYHPDLVLVGRRELTIGTASAENPATYEHITRLALWHVTALEDLPSSVPPGGNGPG